MADAAAATGAMETPSGKWSGDENFPVGSWLLPARLRPHIAAYYAIARTTDDVADNPDLSAEEKIRRLDAFAAAVRGEVVGDPALARAERMRESLAETGLGPRHVLDVIAAFRQDATKRRYAGWDELMGYCNLSASPVGRYVLDLHGEDRATWEVSDPLCNALQVLNHLQDCRDDYRALDRVYLPEPWLAEAGIGVEALDGEISGAALRSGARPHAGRRRRIDGERPRAAGRGEEPAARDGDGDHRAARRPLDRVVAARRPARRPRRAPPLGLRPRRPRRRVRRAVARALGRIRFGLNRSGEAPLDTALRAYSG